MIDPKETQRAKILRERAERDYASLQAIGMSTGETFYPPGTEATLGRSAIRRARQEFAELPDSVEALEGLATTIESENRLDVAATIGTLNRNHEGAKPLITAMFGGFNHGDANYIPTDRAITQIQTRKPLGHPATAWDYALWESDTEPTDVVLRTRSLPPNRADLGNTRSRELFAVVSPSYVPYDLDAVANDLQAACPTNSRARIRYDGAKARVDIILQNPYRLDGGDAAAVGETHRLVLRMSTADDGSAGYNLSLLAERVRCINLTLLHTKKHILRATHRSDNLRDLARDALSQGEDLMSAFGDVWRDSWHEYYADKHTKLGLTGEEAIRRIVGLDKYRIQGLSKEATLEACLMAWASEEMGDSKAHVHNALTRAAHTATVGYSSRWCDDDAEVDASQLLYAKVLTLADYDNA